MAIKALTRSDEFEFVSDKDPAKTKTPLLIDETDPSKGEILTDLVGEGATVFKLAPLDVFLMGYIYDSASVLSGKQGSDEIGIHTRVNATNIDAVRFGLKGAENWLDDKGVGHKVEFVDRNVNGRTYKAATDDTLKKLGLQLIAEMSDKIKKASEVSADEEKNFG